MATTLNTSMMSNVIDEIAADYPKLDKSKYGNEVTSGKDLLRAYAKALTEGMANFLVLENLTSSSKVLTAEAIRTCQVDKDDMLEVVIASLGDEVDQSMNDEPDNIEAEQEEPRQEDDATGTSSPELFDVSPCVEQIK